jgi:hypothetical protein
MRAESRAKTAGLVLVALAVVCLAACQNRKAPSARTVADGELSLADARSALGTAGDYASGVVDVTHGSGVLIISYRYYDADLENYETDFASEIAPRIQALFREYRTLDRIRLQVTSNSPVTSGLWQHFADFELDRRTVEEIHWTGFLARYILDLVIKNRRG